MYGVSGASGVMVGARGAIVWSEWSNVWSEWSNIMEWEKVSIRSSGGDIRVRTPGWEGEIRNL